MNYLRAVNNKTILIKTITNGNNGLGQRTTQKITQRIDGKNGGRIGGNGVRFLSKSSNSLATNSNSIPEIHISSPDSTPELPKSINQNVNGDINSGGFSIDYASGRDLSQFGTKPIYLDLQATTPTDPRVLDKMLQFYTGLYGNPHSSTHAYGWETDKEVETARENVAKVINADPKEIIFTSGATESNNMVIKGVTNFYKKTKKHVITTQTEHKCVLDSCRYIQDDGWDVTYLPVNNEGLINIEDLKNSIRKDTILVSIMAVNNEIGVIQPLKEIGEICRKNKIFFHTDAAQAYGKLPIDVNEMNIDLLSISSHKIYGPKGIGACYVRRRPRVRLSPIINGGGQERGLRSGTLAPPLVAGFGEAAKIMYEEMNYDKKHIEKLSKKLKDSLLSIPETFFNGPADISKHYPGCINISFGFIEGESLIMALKDVALSSGSACTSASLEPSYVLHAIGADDTLAHSSIRFGIGRFTTEDEIDYVINVVNKRVDFLRELSPLWEMHQEGIDLNSIEWTGH